MVRESRAGEETGTIQVYMGSATENCAHLGDCGPSAGPEYRCPAWGELMDLEGVARWVRVAERLATRLTPLVEGDGFGEIVTKSTAGSLP